MPEIKQYDEQAPLEGPTALPKATPEEFGSTIGAANQEFGKQISTLGKAVYDHQTEMEKAQLNSGMSKAQADLEVDLASQVQKGTLDTDDFKQKVQDRMDSLQQDITTEGARQDFVKHSAYLQADFLTHAAHAQAQLTGAKVANDLQKSIEDRSSALFQNPAGFELARQQQSDYIDSLVRNNGEPGGLPAEKADELKRRAETELATSAIRGELKMGLEGPAMVQKELDSGKWDPYIKGDTKYKMLQEVTEQNRANLQDQERLKKINRDAASARQEAAVSSFLQSVHGKGPGSSSNDVLALLRNNVIDSSTAEHLWKVLDTENQDKKLRSNPYVMNTLTQRLSLPDGDPNKITDSHDITSHLGKDISIPDGNLLMGLLEQKHTPQGEADFQNQHNARAAVRAEFIRNELIKDPKAEDLNAAAQAQMSQYALDAANNRHLSQTQIWSPTLGVGKDAKPNPDYVRNHVSTPKRSLEQIMNDKYGTPEGAPPVSTPPSPQSPPQEEMVPMTSPQGIRGKVPKSQADAYVKKGFRRGTN